MTIHKEGYATLFITVLFLVAVNYVSQIYIPETYTYTKLIVFILSIILFLIILQFFRSPFRRIIVNDKTILAPADGKVVVIEEAEENEFLLEKRIQVSIFMSPLNVHVNRYPVSGEVIYSKYHKGLYLVAWHPKSSTANERTSVVIQTSSKVKILMRQIAGALARRIVCYPMEGWKVRQGDEMGFIKFGSRVDLFLPLNTTMKVELNQVVKGGVTIIAELN
jgi:phosphatidylserine decarboxylase